jgi:predicted nucleotidyltransferase
VSRLQSVLHHAARDLAELRYSWALVGGLAVSARTEPRFTRDVDLAIAVTGDAAAERAIGGLQGRGYRIHAVIEQEATSRLATTRLIPPREDPSGIVLDVLFASSGIEPEVVAAAEPLDVLPGLVVPVATIGHLVALKLLARDDRTRPQDRGDLAALMRAAAVSDVEQARSAVALIHDRGFARGRDLAGALHELLREPR